MIQFLLIAQDFAPSYNNTNTQLGDRDLYTGYHHHASTTRQRLEASDARAESIRHRRLQLLDLLVQYVHIIAHDPHDTAAVALKQRAIQRL